MTGCKYLVVLSLVFATVGAECPHQQFVQESVCDQCRGWKEVNIAYLDRVRMSYPGICKLIF
jgi:hypothetical protein